MKPQIKNKLTKIPTMTLKELEIAWTEVILERLGYSRIKTYTALDICKSKLRLIMKEGNMYGDRND